MYPQVVNRHVSAHIEDEQLTMLFRVEDGPSDQSFGINVARFLTDGADMRPNSLLRRQIGTAAFLRVRRAYVRDEQMVLLVRRKAGRRRDAASVNPS